MKLALFISSALTFPVVLLAIEFHVSVNGHDTNSGTQAKPLASIQRAAELAQPGDIITVHAGVYRERINPPRGGTSNEKRIVYQAATGEKVEIKGSEVIKGWVKLSDHLWQKRLTNTFFKNFNPYADEIRGDWFSPKGRKHHTGAVYLNGEWLTEAATLEEVTKPIGATALWFGQVDADSTTLWVQFNRVDPNEALVEINVRQTVFYPDQPGVNYLTVRGFIMRQAATPWAPPTAEQIGLIGTHWSKGWIIENNEISHSICSGIALGKYGDQWDNTSANTAEGYVLTIERALQNGWNKETIGHHLVRHNTIHHCEQAGLVGSLGCAFSTVTANVIHDIHVRRLFSGAEMAGIKFHGAIDVEISDNHIYRTNRGLWLDWMAQGTRVTRNLFHDNHHNEDLFVEVNHGPFMIDNNLFLSQVSLLSLSQGGAYVHNLFTGLIKLIPFDARQTPYLQPHATTLAGMHDNPCGDDRFYNNIFSHRSDMTVYDAAKLPMWMAGNVYLNGAKPCLFEKNPLIKSGIDVPIKLIEQTDGYELVLDLDPACSAEQTRNLLTSDRLAKAAISNLSYENSDGSPIRIDTDYFNRPRNASNPFPGPVEVITADKLSWKVWPK